MVVVEHFHIDLRSHNRKIYEFDSIIHDKTDYRRISYDNFAVLIYFDSDTASKIILNAVTSFVDCYFLFDINTEHLKAI